MREGRSRRRGLLSRRKVWGGRSPSLGRQGPESREKGGERRGIKIVRGSREKKREWVGKTERMKKIEYKIMQSRRVDGRVRRQEDIPQIK